MPLVTQSNKNRVILGLMTFGPDEETGARVTDLNEYKHVLDVFQAKGYHEVDTARVYVGGKQEAFTKSAGWKDRGLTLATKVIYPLQGGMNTAEKVVESVETSLKELGTDTIDLLYLHRPDRGTPFAETLEALDKLHKAGKFVRLGVSNFTAFELAEVVLTCKYNGWVRPTVYQGMYNAITRNLEPELIVACKRYGLDVVVYNPLAGGLFSGKIRSKDVVPESGRFSNTAATVGSNYRARYFKDGTFRALQIVEEATQKENLTLIETALRWLVHHSKLNITDGHDGIILGVSSAQQLEDNLANEEKGPLPESVVKALDEAWAATKGESTNYWHGDVEYHYDPQQALFTAGAK